MDIGELEFLTKKIRKDKIQYYIIYSLLLVFSFIIPFLGSWYRSNDGGVNSFSKGRFIFSSILLVSLSSIATVVTYRKFSYNILKDIKSQTKTIEPNRIKQKVYLAENNTCHFYLESGQKISIEVTVDDYNNYKEGDEICLEYSKHAREYLGYF